MDAIFDLIGKVFNPILEMGGPVIMLIILTVLALLFGVKFSKALEGGIKLAIALTGIGAIIGMLNGAFSASLAKFVENTGIQLSITDVGWAPLATITWGSAWTLYFLLIMLIVNVVMLAMKKTDTLDVDIFDIWHLSITGLLIKWYADNNGVSQGVSLFIATAAIVLVGVLKIINSDLMKPTFDDLLNAPSSSPMTSTHMNYMMNPVIMVLDKIFEKFFPGLDKYDFDAAKLNKKIGFWGSKFFIGFILGIVIGIMGTPHPIAGVADADKWRLVIKGWLSLGLFDQVASLLEEREIVTPTYREALITREKSFPTGLDMEFLGKDLPNVAIPHTDIVHNLAEKVVVVRLEKPVTFHNMIAPDKEVEVSLLFFIINNSSSSQTNILAQLMDFFTGNGHLEDLSKISEPEKLYAYIAEATA
ncbi:PTS system%2C IIC component%2C GatC %2Cgalactitol-specific IIC component [Streptococcus pneumoniae]|nr:PTS system%2C IIC component%2C GatC %2Cgalactitol-specific IIC component [Streptococcus pneumoniae]